MISVCIFGSVARRSTDHMSDRDVLIVGSDSDERRQVELDWRASGWSVSCFSRDHLERMSEFGSVFIQHLKQEGTIVCDDGFLSELLLNFRLHGDYQSQLVHALAPLRWTREAAGIWPRLCAADILFVSLRNIGVLESAMRGHCVFDFDSIVCLIAEIAALDKDQQQALTNLRQCKFSYRSRIPRHIGDQDWERITAAAQQVYRHFAHRYEGGRDTGYKPNGYYMLRRTELQLVERYDPRSLDAQFPAHAHYDLWKLICNPADYPKLQALDLGPFWQDQLITTSIGAPCR